MRRKILRVAALAVLLAGAPALAAAPATDATLDQIETLVHTQFYAPAVLRERGWPARLAQARARIAAGASATERETILATLLASLATSHTGYLPRSDPRYYDLAAIFERVLRLPERECTADTVPPLPIEVDHAGVWWQQVDGAWFVGGVLDGGPAQRAGLLLGDEIVRADGKPFAPVAAFAGRAGRPVALTYRRARHGALATVSVTPERAAPLAAYAQALAASTRVIVRDGRRIGYFRLWSGVGDDVIGRVHDAIRELHGQHADAFVVDVRDGWGGAPSELAAIFDPRVPAVGTRTRDGETLSFDGQIRQPAVVLINGGVRSGKETFAYAVRKHRLATLLGEPTAGAMLSGTVFCLRDGALLYLAVGTPTVDGEVLEGRPTRPHVPVAFDIRYAGGVDRQLDAALERLARNR